MSSSSPIVCMVLALIGCLFVYTECGTAEHKNLTFYKNGPIKLVRVIPTTQRHLSFLKLFQSVKRGRRGLHIQFWRAPDKLKRHADIWVPANLVDKFLKLLKKMRLKYKVISNDIVNEVGEPNITMDNIEDYDKKYHMVEELTSEIRRLAAIYNDIASLEIIGKSFEGRPIYKVHIRTNATIDKPIIFVNCGSHAREWLAIASCQYLLRKLIFDGYYDQEIITLLNKYDVMMVPLLNPDGYRFTENSRLWRKSRSNNSISPDDPKHCYGVDINRNFNYGFGGAGSTSDLCEATFHGPRPFSEREPLALGRYLYKIRRRVAAFMDVHAYGQLWMSPWGYNTAPTIHTAQQEKALKKIQQALKKENKVKYEVGSCSKTLYYTAGCSIDWVYGVLGIIHTYGIELRPRFRTKREQRKDRNFAGFQRHRREIIPNGKDLFVGVKALMLHLMNIS